MENNNKIKTIKTNAKNIHKCRGKKKSGACAAGHFRFPALHIQHPTAPHHLSYFSLRYYADKQGKCLQCFICGEKGGFIITPHGEERERALTYSNEFHFVAFLSFCFVCLFFVPKKLFCLHL